MAFRLAEYLVPKGLKLALLTDDTGYGRAGRKDRSTMRSRRTRSRWSTRIQIPSTATDLAPQILQARRAHATGLIVWGQPTAIAEALIAARSAGWKVPIYTPPAGEDPLVRQELAGHPSWVDGLTFASGRMTAEKGPGPFLSFQAALTQHVRRPAGRRQDLGRPSGRRSRPTTRCTRSTSSTCSSRPRLRAAQSSDGGCRRSSARTRSRSKAPTATTAASTRRTTRASSTTTSTSRASQDMIYAPVKDDALSATLPTIPQEG